MDIDIDKFLSMRQALIAEIEMANQIDIKIGEEVFIARPSLDNDSNSNDCLYQFFNYMKKSNACLIFNHFIAIIGNYDSKEQCLKSWKTFKLLSAEDMSRLKIIRDRYSEIRNNVLAHLNLSYQQSEAHDITNVQVDEDINHLRKILNNVRDFSRLPTVSQGYKASDNYAVKGLQKILDRLLSEPAKDLNSDHTRFEQPAVD